MTSSSQASSIDPPAQHPGSHQWLLNLGITIPFLLLYWVNLAHHELWFDELNAWGIVCAAQTLPHLFRLVHFEGHPWLWYFVLWLPSRLTHDPVAMKIVEGLLGTAIYLVLALLSPFSRLQKILLFGSYFLVFEYTVMSRMYSMMVLLALLYVYRRMRMPGGMIGNAILLGLIANTDMSGVLLSGALLLQYAYDVWVRRRAAGWGETTKRQAVLAVLLYTALVGLSIYTLLPAKEISWQASGHLGSEMFQPRRFVQSIGNLIASPWWPISHDFPKRFWGTDAIENKFLLLLTPFVLFAYWRSLRRETSLILLMALSVGFGALFADVVYGGRVRHWGIAFVAFVVALWMKAYAARSESKNPAWSAWTYALLSVSVLAGITASVSAWTHPFSSMGAVAAWLRMNETPGVPFVGDWDLYSAGVGEELQQPVYFLECGCTDTFKLFSHDRDKFPQNELPQRLELAMQALHTPKLILVNSEPLKPATLSALNAASLKLTLVASFPVTEAEQYGLRLYTVQLP